MTLLTSGGYACGADLPQEVSSQSTGHGAELHDIASVVDGQLSLQHDGCHTLTNAHAPAPTPDAMVGPKPKSSLRNPLEGRCIHNKLGAPAALYGGGDAPGALRHAAFAAADSARRPRRPLADHAVDGADLDEREGRTAEGRIRSLQGGRVGLSKGANGAEVPPAWLLSS